ncbi:MAG: PepSY-like domain-containing protein [Flavobacterium sp.]
MKHILGLIIFLCTGILIGQTKVSPSSVATPPLKVTETFQKEYPNKIPVWGIEYVGHDNDEIRYEAKFNTNDGEALAVYDNLGVLKAFELAIPVSKLPVAALNYLKKNYPNAIREASVVVDYKNKTTYEVGVEKDSNFYDVVFDKNGGFDVIIQKD